MHSAVLASRRQYARGLGDFGCVQVTCVFYFVKICFCVCREGERGMTKAIMCGGVVAVLIGHGEAPDLLKCCGFG